MSLYRQAGGHATRALVVAAVVGVLVGGLIGFLGGRGSADDPSAAEVVADARAGVRPVSTGLEVLPIEYEGSVDRGRITARTEYEAARAAARARRSRADGHLGGHDGDRPCRLRSRPAFPGQAQRSDRGRCPRRGSTPSLAPTQARIETLANG